jgi:hypothetical protein
MLLRDFNCPLDKLYVEFTMQLHPILPTYGPKKLLYFAG